MRVYVGNLSFDVTQGEIQQMFAAHGKVQEVSLITDRASGRSKGFAFVEMPDKSEAQAAIAALNGKQLRDRALTVNEARPREERSFGGPRFDDGPRGGGYGRQRDRR